MLDGQFAGDRLPRFLTLLTVLVAATMAGIVSTANAAPIQTFHIDFSFSAPGLTPDPVIGAVTIEHDFSVDAIEQTAGLTLNSLNFDVGEVGFQYGTSADVLIIGGTINTVLGVNEGTDDFFLWIKDFLASPYFFLANSSRVDTGSVVQAEVGIIKVTEETEAVPVPPAWALLSIGLVGVGLGHRKSPKRTALVVAPGQSRRLSTKLLHTGRSPDTN